MQDRFSAKVNDFVKWCETAIDHYNRGYYADSLLNMRKSGEAACKLMFYYRFTDKVAMGKTEGKSYKELIQAVISHDLAERKIINWLEAMQIHGNDAAHDMSVKKEHAEFAINALRLFIEWMFTQCIKVSIPTQLKKAMLSVHQPVKNEDASIQIQKELDKIKKDKENLEKQLVLLTGTKSEEEKKINKLASELEKSNTRLKDLEEEKEKIKIKEETVFVAEEIKTEKKKTFTRKQIIYASTIVGSVIIILFFVTTQWNNTFFRSKSKTEPHQQISAVDSFRVLMLPLSIMQDNPNMTIKFEDAVQSRIQQRVKEKNLPISITYDRSFVKPTISFDEAAKEGIKNKANIVLFGDLYEPQTSSDSTQVNMKFSMTREQNRVTEEMGLQSFLRLSDSTSIKIQMGAACYVDLAYAEFLKEKGKYNEALIVLYDAQPISKKQQYNVADFLAECHSARSNYSAAIKEIEKLIVLEPGDDYSYAFMANVLYKMGDFKKAEEHYKKALSIKPNNVNTLMNYASLLACKDINRLAQSKELLLRAINYDSTNGLAWRYLADLEYMEFDYKPAEKHYRKSLSIDSTSTIAKTSLAQLLAFNLGQPEEGEKILIAILRKNDKDATALFILANIYTSTTLINPDKAQYLLALSKKYQTTQNDYSNNFAEGLALMQKNDFGRAVVLLVAAYRIDSTNIQLCSNIANCYLNLHDYDKSFYYMVQGWKKDTLDYVSNSNMGYFYVYSDKKYYNLKKASYYFEKAIKTNPYDTICLENLGNIYLNQGNNKGAKDMYLRLYNLNPNSFNANAGLGSVYEMENDYKKAVKFLEKAVTLRPNNDLANAKYALILMKVSSNNYSTAMIYAKKAVEINPRSGDNLFILSQMYIISKNYSLAKDYYDRALALKPTLKDAIVEQELEALLKQY